MHFDKHWTSEPLTCVYDDYKQSKKVCIQLVKIPMSHDAVTRTDDPTVRFGLYSCTKTVKNSLRMPCKLLAEKIVSIASLTL